MPGGIAADLQLQNVNSHVIFHIIEISDSSNASGLKKDNTPQTMSDELQVYPNPGNGIFNLKLKNDKVPISINVFDKAGNLIMKKIKVSSQRVQIDLSKYNTGLYMLQVLQGFNTMHKILIKN